MRARNLKPAFFKNEDLADLPFEYRLLFQGLWCIADAQGRLEDRPKRIKADIFPYDSVDVVAGLDSLQAKGFIERYTASEVACIQIVNFSRHQHPHKKEQANPELAPCKNGASTGDSGASPASCLIPHTESLMPHTANGRHEAKAAETLKASQPRERITKRDLDNAATTDGFYQRAVSFGDIPDSELNRIGFHAVAVRASSKGKDAGALFVSLVKKRAWTLPSSDGGPSEADYDKARSRLKHLLPRSQLGAVSTAANGFGLPDEKGGTR